MIYAIRSLRFVAIFVFVEPATDGPGWLAGARFWHFSYQNVIVIGIKLHRRPDRPPGEAPLSSAVRFSASLSYDLPAFVSSHVSSQKAAANTDPIIFTRYSVETCRVDGKFMAQYFRPLTNTLSVVTHFSPLAV